MTRLIRLVALAALGLVTAAPALAQAGDVLDEAAADLPRDPVYVHPDAPLISEAEQSELRRQIQEEGVPVFIAVLPDRAVNEAGGSVNALPDALASRVGLSGAYAVALESGFRATSRGIPPVGGLATAALQSKRDDGRAAVLEEFVRLVGESLGGAAVPAPDVEVEEETDGGGSNLPLLLLLGGGVGAAVLLTRKSRRRSRDDQIRSEEEEEADRQLLRAELAVLADDVMRLEPEVQIHPEARPDYDAAVARYRAAEAALDYADDPIDLIRVGRVVAEAQYAMSRARARLEGRDPPPPPDDLRAPGRHDEPPVDLDDEGEPVYAGYRRPFYGGGGWFGAGGGLLGGLLLGSMLDGWGDDHHDWHDGGAGVGDSGGGGWGGGDVGGGDWGGGGDVGGGDW